MLKALPGGLDINRLLFTKLKFRQRALNKDLIKNSEWTVDEDRQLVDAVKLYGGIN